MSLGTIKPDSSTQAAAIQLKNGTPVVVRALSPTTFHVRIGQATAE